MDSRDDRTMRIESNHEDNNQQQQKYHGQRRNAHTKFDNLRTFKFRRNENESSNTNYNIHRVQEGGIKHRLNNPRSQYTQSTSGLNRIKYTHNKPIISNKWKKGDLYTNRQLASDDLVRNRDDQRFTRNPRSQAKRTEPIRDTDRTSARSKLKIGESNDVKKDLPPTQSHCKLKIIEQNVFDLVVNFLQQYFICFDKNRDELVAAYHERCTFSLSLNVNSLAGYHTTKFGSYFKESRNLLYVTGQEKLSKTLHVGSLETVTFLKRLPQTEHEHNSLKLDVSYFTQNMLTFSVIGVFREGGTQDKSRPFRSFQKVLACIPTADGRMIIVNEQLTISNLSLQQSKIHKEDKFDNITITKTVQNEPISSGAASNVSVNQIEVNKQNMIVEFSKFSNLNVKWSTDCLTYADWNFEKAKISFLEHRSQIPADAYI